MILLISILLPLTLIYAARVVQWRHIWLLNGEIEVVQPKSSPFISVVIAVKNEANQVASLIESIKNQTYPTDNYEVILVNDHSTDQTAEIIATLTADAHQFKLTDNIAFGKKAALREGIAMSVGEIVITTDADCIHHENWLSTIAAFQSRQPSDLIIAPVTMIGQGGSLQPLFELEFLALQLATAATAMSQKPIMCNGANLIFRKEHHRRADLRSEYASGDDMFLLINLMKKNAHISYLKNRNATVTTATPRNYIEYLHQRSRWLRKATGYTQPNIIATALMVMVGNIAWPLALLLAVNTSNMTLLSIGFALFLIKYLSDYSLLKSGAGFFNINIKHRYVLLLAFLYPLMVVSIGVTTLLKNKKKW